MDVEKLFIERCRQVETLSRSHKEIDLLDLSAKLRQLLLDGEPLVHSVNKNYRLKLKFRVGSLRHDPDPSLMLQTLEDGVDPETSPPWAPAKEVDFDGFVGLTILFIRGESHTVRDVIKHASDVAGGVHSGNLREQQRLLDAYSRSVSFFGLPGTIRMLQAIARVALRGLRPLIEALEASGAKAKAAAQNTS